MTSGLSPHDADVYRCFYAVDLSERVRAVVAAAQEQLRLTGASLSLPKPRDVHLTLVFLGHVFAAQVASFAELLDRAAAAVAPFRFTVGGVGAFGPAHVPRVVWAGVTAPSELARLQGRLAEGAKLLGVPIEDRAYKPHVTLARVKTGRNLRALTSLMTSIRNASFGEVPVTRAYLLRSHLEQPDARYTVLHTSPLKGS